MFPIQTDKIEKGATLKPYILLRIHRFAIFPQLKMQMRTRRMFARIANNRNGFTDFHFIARFFQQTRIVLVKGYDIIGMLHGNGVARLQSPIRCNDKTIGNTLIAVFFCAEISTP